MAHNFLSRLTGSFAMPAAENPTVAMVEAAYRHHGLDIRYINCEVPPERLGDAVKGARAMGWIGFNCSIPHKVAVIDHLDGLGESAAVMESQESLWYNPRHPGDAARVGLPAPVKALLDGLALEHFQDMLE